MRNQYQLFRVRYHTHSNQVQFPINDCFGNSILTTVKARTKLEAANKVQKLVNDPHFRLYSVESLTSVGLHEQDKISYEIEKYLSGIGVWDTERCPYSLNNAIDMIKILKQNYPNNCFRIVEIKKSVVKLN